MSAPTDFQPSISTSGRAGFGAASASALSMKWAALQEAGSVVSMMAGFEPDKSTSEIRNFPAIVKSAGGWRLEAARRGIEDLTAVMEAGMAALLAVNARGADASAPAKALRSEFRRAKTAVLQLAPPAGNMGPRRSA
ncbi:hypothetical protein ACXYN8_13265 [Altererythrobacter sp. CAU 1778]